MQLSLDHKFNCVQLYESFPAILIHCEPSWLPCVIV
uniref:Uncharacterized protein n=1 Tax=Rhizophora mucronata TaxID=61149 RepID=A0A2P2PUJ7_RHIMU